ncbi:MAG: helix-turn-helix transcriptional regulator [Magnetococcus sp. YQC-3]
MSIKVCLLDAGELTPRESEVFVLIARGLDDKRIARQLEVSTKTVSAHCDRIYQKMQARRDDGNARVFVVAKALAKGMISITEGD